MLYWSSYQIQAGGEVMSKENWSRERISELLIKTADLCRESGEAKDEKKMASLFSSLAKIPVFRKYNLEEKDWKLIAILYYGGYFEGDYIPVIDMMKNIEENRISIFSGLKRIVRLRELCLIELERSYGLENKPDKGIYECDVRLLRSGIGLSEEFFHILYHGTEKKKKEIRPYKDNLEYLSDLFEMVKSLSDEEETFFTLLKEGMGEVRRSASDAGENKNEERTAEIKKIIAERLKLTKRSFPFEKFGEENELNSKEELIVLILLEAEVTSGRSYDVDDILNIISRSPYEKIVDRELLEPEGRLIKNYIVEVSYHNIRFREEEVLRLNEAVVARLLGKKVKRERSKLKEDNFFEEIKPAVSLDKVILHPKTREEINLAMEMVSGNTASILSKWGVKGNMLVKSSSTGKRRQSVIMLFHGAPGTGKTLTVHAVAAELKRRILTLDCSRILSKWVGKSEANTKKIFKRYREISRGKKNPPVLLLNEADQFLQRRINVTRSPDNMYNQMQNIFLEQLERFEGILIATTNLVDNFDAAFSRRFHYKILFKRPGPKERLMLWEVHLPPKAPLSDDVDLASLSEQYNFTGGQIAVAVRNAATKAAMRNGSISQADFISACEGERAGNFDGGGRAEAGF